MQQTFLFRQEFHKSTKFLNALNGALVSIAYNGSCYQAVDPSQGFFKTCLFFGEYTHFALVVHLFNVYSGASFNRSAGRIEALVDAQKALLANASHELRSPLTRIRMAVELMVEQPTPAMRSEMVRNIAELDLLIDEILLASRLDGAGESVQTNELIDLTALLAEECARVDARLDAPNITFTGNSKLLRRMLRNLLENAQRYGDGTAITVSLSAPTPQQLSIDVCDGGRGVPPAEREKIFAPFYRLPGARERDGGVGLGLSLVRQIARAHRGEVVCQAGPQRGSCFRVTLPR